MKLELLSTGALLIVPAHGEGGSLGKGVLLGVLGGYSPDAGPWVLFHGRGEAMDLLRKAFIRCDLVKVTIFTFLNYK